MDYGLFERKREGSQVNRKERRAAPFSVFGPEIVNFCLLCCEDGNLPLSQLYIVFWLVETSSKLNNIYFTFPVKYYGRMA